MGRTTLGEIVSADETAGGGSIALQGRVNSVPNAYLFFVLESYYKPNPITGVIQLDAQTMFSDGLAQEDLSNYIKVLPKELLGVPLGYNQLENDTPFASELVPIDDFESSTENNPPFGLLAQYNASTNSIDVSFSLIGFQQPHLCLHSTDNQESLVMFYRTFPYQYILDLLATN